MALITNLPDLRNAIHDGIRDCQTTCTELTLFYSLSQLNYDALLDILENNTSIKKITFHCYGIDANSLRIIQNIGVTTICLYNKSVDCDVQKFRHLIQCFTNLKEIELCNDISHSFFLLSKFPSFSSIKLLNCSFGSDELDAFLEQTPNISSLSIIHFYGDLNNVFRILEKNKTIQSLNIIEYDGVPVDKNIGESLSNMIKTNKTITSLSLSMKECPINVSDMMFESLLLNTTIHTLSFCTYNVSEITMMRLKDLISNGHITTLKFIIMLQFLDDRVLDSLSHNHTLTSLTCNLTTQGMKLLLTILQTNRTLQRMTFKYHWIEHESEWMDLLQSNPMITSLRFEQADVSTSNAINTICKKNELRLMSLFLDKLKLPLDLNIEILHHVFKNIKIT